MDNFCDVFHILLSGIFPVLWGAVTPLSASLGGLEGVAHSTKPQKQ